jgi:hypothetical protein
MSTQQLKLSFNKPTYNSFFEGHEASGVQIRIRNGVVGFRPASDSQLSNEDVVPLFFNRRGGFHIFIGDGYDSDAIAEALENPYGPYFRLHRADNGWIEATPFAGYDPTYGAASQSGEPNRWMPYMRVWNLGRVATRFQKPRKENAADPEQVSVLIMQDFFQKMKRCHSEESLMALRFMADFFTNVGGMIKNHVRAMEKDQEAEEVHVRASASVPEHETRRASAASAKSVASVTKKPAAISKSVENLKKRTHHAPAAAPQFITTSPAQAQTPTETSKTPGRKHSRYLRRLT